MSFVYKLKEQIDKGRTGTNWGLSMGLPKIESIVDGVSQEVYTLLFGGTGSGKTSYVLFAYIYKPLIDNLYNDAFNIIYYSLEMSGELLLAKLACLYIYDKYGVEISVKQILSKIRGSVLSEEEYEYVKDALEWLKLVEKRLLIYDKNINSKVFYAHLSKEMEKYGTTTETEHRKIYTLNNPKQITLVIIDHLGLIRTSDGRTKKQEIDLISSYLVTMRNRCKISPVAIFQMNRGAASMDRRLNNFSEPQLDDIKETGNPSEDAEIVIAIYNPYKEKQASYKGYKITNGFKDSFRAICCLKNRYGDADVSVGVQFMGKIGYWKELPPANEINDYSKYTNNQKEIVKDNTSEKEITNKNKFNFVC